MTELEQRLAERDDLLRSLDVEGMVAYLRRQSVGVIERRAVLRGMHLARVMLPSMTEAQRAESRAWLREQREPIPPCAIDARN